MYYLLYIMFTYIYRNFWNFRFLLPMVGFPYMTLKLNYHLLQFVQNRRLVPSGPTLQARVSVGSGHQMLSGGFSLQANI